MEHVEGRLAGVDGVGLYWQGWLPAGTPRGLLLICHGMGEHSGRYATVRDALVPDGWAVYALDHRGHGRSRGPRVHVRRYAHYLADFDTFRRAVVARHPDLRPFLLGQSMGGRGGHRAQRAGTGRTGDVQRHGRTPGSVSGRADA